MKRILLLVLAFKTIIVSAQTAEDSVKAAVNNLFTAMRDADSVALINAFAPGAILQTISRSKDGLVVKSELITDFSGFIAKQSKGAADERITFESIKIDGPLANVWTPYKFYYKGQFSHCGVNSFQLVKLNGEWKIQYIIDTRRKQNCN